jgi:hypothetical protein
LFHQYLCLATASHPPRKYKAVEGRRADIPRDPVTAVKVPICLFDGNGEILHFTLKVSAVRKSCRRSCNRGV